MRVLIVSGSFYSDISDMLEQGAISALEAAGAEHQIVRVPGAFEIPGVIARHAARGLFDAYVALGCIIRGETSHYDYVCMESARGLMDLSTRQQLAIGYGVLTVEHHAQALKRADPTLGNKGKDAVLAALCVAEQ